jgi:peptide/nickel transport system permease protein
MYFCPGDPAMIILGPGAKKAEIDNLRVTMGLDQPFFVQLGKFLYNLFFKFDLGVSYITRVGVWDEIMVRFPITLVFAFSAMIISVLAGLPLGIMAATHQNHFADSLCMTLALLGVCIPGFWLGLEMMLLFALKLRWLPAFGIDSWQGWILPVFVNSIGSIAMQARQTRSSMLEVIRSDYVVTARAKGLSEKTILYKYMLPNGLIPIIQTMGNNLGVSLGGTIIIENVFSISGIGMYMTGAVASRDYAVIRGSVVVLAIMFSFVMLLVDICFAFVDPRIKAQYENLNKRPRWLMRKAHA